MKFFLFLFVSCICLMGSNLIKNGDFVIDRTNALMWEDTQQTVVNKVAQINSDKYCASLGLGGYSNWRVPSVEEYKFVVDRNIKDDVKIAREFRHRLPVKYWTNKTTWRNFGLWAYYVYLKSATFYYDNKTYLKYIRCIRSTR